MERLLPWLAPRWFGCLLVVAALLLGFIALLLYRKQKTWSVSLLGIGGALALAGIGGLVVPGEIGFWLAIGSASLLFLMFIWLLMTGQWWTPLALAAGAALFLGSGAWSGKPASAGLVETVKMLVHLEAVHKWWLLLLGLIPIVIWMGHRSMAGLGPARKWLAIGLRCALVLFLTLALADVRLRQPNDTVTVLFVLDRSLSIPPEFDPNAPPDSRLANVDLRWERIKKFINDAVEKRGDAHQRDKAGLIVFGRRPRLELPPSDVPRFNFQEVASVLDPNYTDIGSAIKLALASFPEGSGKRIVLISDGNENLGNAEEQARIAKLNGVQIDVVPLAAGFKNEDEVMVQSVEAPPLTEQGSRFPIRVLVRSYNPRLVKGTLTLRQIADGKTEVVPPSPLTNVTLRPGLNSIPFPPPKDRPKGSYTYEAIFEPKGVVVNGQLVPGLPGDRVQNNRATTHVIALGQRRILVIEATGGEHKYLVDALRGIKDSKFQVHSITTDKLPQDKAELGVFLSNYDCIILANVPSELINEEQQEMLRSNTYDQGCGLIMIGGPESFGAGGWQGTPVEKALPVDCDIKSMKVQGKGGLVLVMHASEMADGNMWQKKIANLAIEKLGPMDMLGVLHYDWNGTMWHIPFQTVGEKRKAMTRLVDKMTPGDMPEFDTGLQMAYNKLTDARYELAKKHIIIISDGDPSQTNAGLLAQMKQNKVTITTVGVATHSATEDAKMAQIAMATGGRTYSVKNPKALPEIYTKETRLVSQSFVYDKRFVPKLEQKSGPTEALPDPLSPLYGFVRTTAKPSPLVSTPILGPPQGEQQFPILAFWQYGLGKAVAFTSDARSNLDRVAWDKDWASSDMYVKFWEQVVDYSVRAVETGKLNMTTEYKDGKVKVIVDARDKDNRPLTDLNLKGGVTPPGVDTLRKVELRFEQKNSGLYEAEFKADEAGSYFINAQAVRMVKKKEGGKEVTVPEVDSIRSGVTIPYSPEFADMESNVALLEKLRSLTEGKTYEDADSTLARAAASGEIFRAGLPMNRSLQPIWFWLVLLAGCLLFFDVAVRRIAIEPAEVAAAASRLWERLRGRAAALVETPAFIARLQSRKAQVDETLERARASQRFDPGAAPPAAPRPDADEPPPAAPAPKPPEPPKPKPAPAAADEGDFASRLMKAKKRAMEERDKKDKK